MATVLDRKVTRRGKLGGLGNAPVAASILLPHGTMVFRDASGYATNIIAAGANPFLGVAHERFDNSDGANGDLDAEYWIEGRFEMGGSGFTQADIGKKVYAVDNNTLSLTATSQTYVGTITEFNSATSVEVQIDTQAP